VTADTPESEWKTGWRIVAAMAIANGTGIALLFYTFSMFLIPLSAELKLTRGEIGLVQATIITAAIGAPLLGRLTDRVNLRLVFTLATLALTAIELAMARYVSSMATLVVAVAFAGLFGGGTSNVLLTRPINAHFRRYRGQALGLVAIGVSITTIIVPPILEQVIAARGWREGFFALAMILGVVGLPLVLMILPRDLPLNRIGPVASGIGAAPAKFWRERDFVLMVCANLLVTVSISGTISQLSPMVQDENLSAATAALGLSLFAAGQFVGKLLGGMALDRFDPRRVAVLMTVLPATGFLLFLTDSGLTWPILLACAMIGLLQGAEIDIFAYFVARRFDVTQFGTIYGTLTGIGWIGSAVGIIAFGLTFDRFASYAPIQLGAVLLLAIAACLFVPIKLREEP
jgi:predicted MFS family arabinose efflux permease